MESAFAPEFVTAEFVSRFGARPRVFQAPGRINIIGEHTDYNGGLVLPATVDLFTWGAMAPRDDTLVRVHICSEDRTHCFDLKDIRRDSSGQSVDYVKGVAWALQEAGHDPGGCDLVIDGNIPLGGGLSSSASLEVVLGCAFLDCAGVNIDRAALARICQRAETEFVGVQCGIMDQYVIALGAAGHAMMLDCRSLEYQQLSLPDEARFLVVHSGVKRRLPAGSYNTRAEECRQAMTALNTVMPELQFLTDLGLQMLEAQRDLLGEVLYRRCRHVVTENQRTADAVAALLNAKLATLGSLLNQSHASLRDDYEVSCKELDRLTDIALSCDGVLGARMMGAGFGGCIITLVEPDSLESAIEKIGLEYGAELCRRPWMHVVRPADAVKRIDCP